MEAVADLRGYKCKQMQTNSLRSNVFLRTYLHELVHQMIMHPTQLKLPSCYSYSVEIT